MTESTGSNAVEREIDGSPAEQPIGVETWKFPKLTPYDRADILRALKKARRAELIETLKLTGADKAELFGELARFDAAVYREGEFLDHILSCDGRADVIRCSLAKTGRADVPAIPLDGELSLVAELCGVKLTVRPAGEGESDGDDPADPQEPGPKDTYTAPAAPTT